MSLEGAIIAHFIGRSEWGQKHRRKIAALWALIIIGIALWFSAAQPQTQDPIVRTGTDTDTGQRVGMTRSGKIIPIK